MGTAAGRVCASEYQASDLPVHWHDLGLDIMKLFCRWEKKPSLTVPTVSTMFLRNILLPLALSFTLALATATTPDPGEPLPTVDLGYGIYRASYYNVRVPRLRPLPPPPHFRLPCPY